MIQLEKRMAITKVKNGWILEFPKPQQADQFMSGFAGLANQIKGIDADPMLERPAEQNEPDFFPQAIRMMEMEVYVFLSFTELMTFIEKTFEQVD